MKNTLVGLCLSSLMLVTSVSAQEKLTATIIGSGSPQMNENRASASVLIEAGDTKVLVDMGNGTQANLNKLGVKTREISHLFFTHHHLDHNEEFVPIFISALMGKNDFTIVGPPNTSKLAEVNLDLYQEDIAYRLGKTQRTIAERQKAFSVRDLKGGDTFNVADIKVSTLKVPHTIYTLAYRFDYKGESIVVTGDLTYSDELPAFAKNADYMIIDSGGMIMVNGRAKKQDTGNKTKRVRAHLDLDDSSTLAHKANVKNLVYTHFTKGTVDTQKSLEEIRKNYTGNVIFSEDLMVINNAQSVQNSKGIATGYPIVDTGQRKAYSSDESISLPSDGDDYFGQDATYSSNEPSYTDNNDGTITDNVTGLTWQKDMGEKLSYEQAVQVAEKLNLAGHSDWRVPTIKELYSLIQFSGSVKGAKAITPFIDTSYFNQLVGDTNAGEREIDAQTWSSTEYVGKTMNKDDTVFGVNFVDGRIKGYPKYDPRSKEANKMYFRLVRGNQDYGNNNFVDNGDGTVSDLATGLMWQQADSGKGLNWQEALEYSEGLSLGGHDDWRLPNAKELQSIVDYSRSPETSNSAAIDPLFLISSIKNEGGEKDYPYYWSSTTHLDGPVPEKGAVYIAFGKALGEMHDKIMDVHGAGSQRSDPKTGEPMSRGPQGDMIRVDNYVRSVRGGDVTLTEATATENVGKFTSSDTSGKSTVSQKPSSSSSNNKFINRLDKNRDGKVSSSEFKGDAKRFKHFDKNNDGYISADEAPTGPPKKAR